MEDLIQFAANNEFIAFALGFGFIAWVIMMFWLPFAVFAISQRLHTTNQLLRALVDQSKKG